MVASISLGLNCPSVTWKKETVRHSGHARTLGTDRCCGAYDLQKVKEGIYTNPKPNLIQIYPTDNDRGGIPAYESARIAIKLPSAPRAVKLPDLQSFMMCCSR